MALLKNGCWQCRQAGTRVVCGVSDEVVDAFDRAHTPCHYQRGDFLFLEGSPGRGLFCLKSGRVKLYRSSADGKVQLLSLVGPGQFLGHRELLTGQPCSCSAEVLAGGDICFLEREVVARALERDSALARNIMLSLAESLDQAEARLLEMARMRASARIASLLLQCSEANRLGAVDPLTREEMAQLSGLTLESVSRAVRALGRQGLLSFEGRRIFVLDRPGLERVRLG